MIRSELVQSLADANADLARRDVEAAVNAFFDVIAERLAVDGRVELRGLGAFSTRARSQRVRRNLSHAERVDGEAQREPSFNHGQEVRARRHCLPNGTGTDAPLTHPKDTSDSGQTKEGHTK